MNDEIKAALREMLGPDVGIGVTDPREELDDLYPEERALISRAVPKRLFEFAAGRRAARIAMKELGLEPVSIPVGAQREPLWPSSLVGSITHCDTVCIAVVSQSHRALGLDIEPATPLPDDLIDIVCTEKERHWLATLPRDERDLKAKHLFSTKEAFYKAQYPLTGRVLGFEEVELHITDDGHLHIERPSKFAAIGICQTRLAEQNTLFLSTCVIS